MKSGKKHNGKIMWSRGNAETTDSKVVLSRNKISNAYSGLLEVSVRLFLLWFMLLLPFSGMCMKESSSVVMAGSVWHPSDTSVRKVEINGRIYGLDNKDFKGIDLPNSGPIEINLFHSDGKVSKKEIRLMPPWLSLIPPLIAICFALVFKEVIVALLSGIFSGAVIAGIYGNSDEGIIANLLNVVDEFILSALVPDVQNGEVDKGHMSIVLFSVLIGGIVGLISRNGGMQALVQRMSKQAQSPKAAQLSTYLMGILVFFDDYANTLIVGNTMRPLTDRLKVSREKLAYIVDSTAAPVAALAFITTWIGAELAYISEGIASIDGLDGNVYGFFFRSLQYSFYPILTLFFIAVLILKNKDFGPMLRAERLARRQNSEHGIQQSTKLDSTTLSGNKLHLYNAVIPIMVVILGTLAGLLYTGWDTAIWQSDKGNALTRISAIIGNSDSYLALLWASFWGLAAAVGTTVLSGSLRLKESIDHVLDGFRSMVPPVVILVLAWALASQTDLLGTANFLSDILKGNISPYAVPGLTFVLAALIAFSTGSSWGTMAILYPIMLPSAWAIGLEYGLVKSENLDIFYNVISCVLAGSVLGDHCSPISDTTIMSSMACECNHIDHVRTQLPYALTVGMVALVFGTLLVHVLPVWLCLFTAAAILYLIISYLGKKPDE